MQEAPLPIRHIAFRSINKPLMFGGVERRLFFISIMFGAAIFNLFSTFLGGLGTFALLYALSAWATHTDPQIVAIMSYAILNSKTAKSLYDPAQIDRCNIRILKSK